MKRSVPLLITFLGGSILIIAYFIPWAQGWEQEVLTWFAIIAAIAFILGGGNLLKINLKKVSDRAKGWGYSVVCIVAFAITLIIGLTKVGVPPDPMYADHGWSGAYNVHGSPFWWIYQYLYRPLTATMFAMLAFYIASAAFRAFRAKNFEAILLLGTAFIILLGRTFTGVLLTDWINPEGYFSALRIENMTVYIMQIFNTAGNRAIMIGIALGVAATSLKIILGVDRSYLGSGD